MPSGRSGKVRPRPLRAKEESGPAPNTGACRVVVSDMALREEFVEGGQVKDSETLAITRRPREETAQLGRKMYERDIRQQVEAGHHGEVVAIDVDSGSWAVADGEVASVDRLRETCPSAVNVLCERVGHRALRSFGAGSVRRVG